MSSKSNSVFDFFLLRVNWLFLLCLQIELCNLVLKSSQNLAELWHMANKLPGSASRGEWRGPWFGFNLPFLLICFVSLMNEDWGIVFLTSSGWKGLIKSLYKRWHGFWCCCRGFDMDLKMLPGYGWYLDHAKSASLRKNLYGIWTKECLDMDGEMDWYVDGSRYWGIDVWMEWIECNGTWMASGPRRALTWIERWIDMLMDQDIEGLMCGWNGLSVMESE